MKGIAATTIAGCFALAAFAVAIVAGLASGNAASSILVRAILALVACYPLGLMIGLIAQRVIQDHIDAHRADHPTPETMGENSVDNSPDEEEVLVV